MEPRPHERGNSRKKGHNLGSACGFNGATSSRTWKPLRQVKRDLPQVWASMEPRHHEPVNPPLNPPRPWPHISLQWSHVLTNVETLRVISRYTSHPKLQWSHVLTNVET